jgi:hypothetical protein
MIEVIRVKNPQTFKLDDVREFVEKAYSAHSFMTPDNITDELTAAVDDPASAVFLAREGRQWKGFIHVMLPTSAAVQAASVPFFFSERAPKVRDALLAEMVNFITENGYTRMITVDANKKPRGFQRLFNKVGKSREVGRVYEFDLTETRYERAG